MRFIGNVIEKLQRHPKRVHLPEGEEPRILQAVSQQFRALNLGAPIVLGDEEKVKKVAAEANVSLEGIRVINPEKSEDLENFVKRFHSAAAKKACAPLKRRGNVAAELLWRTMLAMHQADGLISGASHITGSVRGPLFQWIKLAPDIKDGVVLHDYGSGRHTHRPGWRAVYGRLWCHS